MRALGDKFTERWLLFIHLVGTSVGTAEEAENDNNTLELRGAENVNTSLIPTAYISSISCKWLRLYSIKYI